MLFIKSKLKASFPFCFSEKHHWLRPFLLSLLDEFNTTVLGATFICVVVSYGFMRALANGAEVEWIYAHAFEGFHNCFCTLL